MVKAAITPGQMKPLFARGPYNTLRLLVFILLSLGLMTLDRQQHLNNVRSTLSLLIYPVQYTVDLPFRMGAWISDSLTLRSRLLRENAELRSESLVQNAQLQKLDSLANENERLRALLQSSTKVQQETRVAELLAVDLDPFRREILINKGSLHGVVAGLPLIDASGLMGQIIHVSPLSSMALLITDPSHAVPVQIDRNGLRALALGTGIPDRLELPYVPTDADIQVGDLLVTSGLGGRFPPDYPVAKVISVEHDPNLTFAKIRAEPTARLEHNREVLLVLSEPEVTVSADAPPTEEAKTP